MITSGTNNVLIDPSLIVARWTIGNTFDQIEKLSGEGFEFYLPGSFYDILLSVADHTEHAIYRFAVQRAQPAEHQEVLHLIKHYSQVLKPFEISREQKEKYANFYAALTEIEVYPSEYYDLDIARVLFEEFIFLQEYSFIVSRIKNAFNKIIDAGAVCMQFGKRSVDVLVRKSVKKEKDDLITKVDVLRSFGKWVAVGGPSVLTLFEPTAAVFGSLAAGYFLLFDPM